MRGVGGDGEEREGFFRAGVAGERDEDEEVELCAAREFEGKDAENEGE